MSNFPFCNRILSGFVQAFAVPQEDTPLYRGWKPEVFPCRRCSHPPHFSPQAKEIGFVFPRTCASEKHFTVCECAALWAVRAADWDFISSKQLDAVWRKLPLPSKHSLLGRDAKAGTPTVVYRLLVVWGCAMKNLQRFSCFSSSSTICSCSTVLTPISSAPSQAQQAPTLPPSRRRIAGTSVR